MDVIKIQEAHNSPRKLAGILASAVLLSGSVASAQLVQMNLDNSFTNSGSLAGSGFNDGSGGSFTASGGGYTGQAGDYAWIRGAGQGVAFGADGATSTTYSALNNLTGVTWAMWVKIPTPANGNFFQSEYATTHVSMHDEATGSTELNPGGWQTPGLDQSTMSNWTFISLRWDGVAGTTTVKQGGLAGGTLATPISASGVTTGNTGAISWNLRWLGGWGPSFSDGVQVDNARFYGSALSDTDLQNVYNADVAAISAIPEPSSFAMIMGAAMGVMALGRRRRRTA